MFIIIQPKQLKKQINMVAKRGRPTKKKLSEDPIQDVNEDPIQDEVNDNETC